jgi:hypothetical protein
MRTFTSDPAVIVVGNHTSGHGLIDPGRYSSGTDFVVRRFVSEPAEYRRQFQVSGGYLVWTTRKNNMDSVHASRVHGSLYGSIPINHPWDDTMVNVVDGNVVESTGIVSPFFSSPSVCVNDVMNPVIAAVSHGLSIFSCETNGFHEEIHETGSRNSPVAAKINKHAGELAAGYLLDSGNLYYESEIPESTQ